MCIIKYSKILKKECFVLVTSLERIMSVVIRFYDRGSKHGIVTFEKAGRKGRKLIKKKSGE